MSDTIAELGELLVLSGARVCFWSGGPPCPYCGGDHNATAYGRQDAEGHRRIRERVAREGGEG